MREGAIEPESAPTADPPIQLVDLAEADARARKLADELAIRRHGPWDLRGRTGKTYGWPPPRPAAPLVDLKG